MDYEELVEKLKEVEYQLKKIKAQYGGEVETLAGNPGKIEVHHHHTTIIKEEHHFSPWWWFSPSPSVTNVNHYHYGGSGGSESSKKSKKKSKEEKEDSEDKPDPFTIIMGIVVGVSAAFIGTYAMSKDEYLSFKRSQVSKDKEEIKTQILITTLGPKYSQWEKAFIQWHNLFTTRTKPKTYAKGALVGSGLGFAATVVGWGMGRNFWKASPILVTLATGSACYLLWNNMTSDLEKEKKTLNKVLELLTELRQEAEKYLGPVSIPSSASHQPAPFVYGS